MKKLMITKNVGLLLSEDVNDDKIKIIGINHYGMNHRVMWDSNNEKYQYSLNYLIKKVIMEQMKTYIKETTIKKSLVDILKDTLYINILDKYFSIDNLSMEMLDTAFMKFHKENYFDIKFHDIISKNVITIIHNDKYSYSRDITNINVETMKITQDTLNNFYAMRDFKEFCIIYNCLKSLIQNKEEIKKIKPLLNTIMEIKKLFLKAKTIQYYSKKYEKWMKEDYLYLSRVFNTWIKENKATKLKYARKEIDLKPLL